MCLGIPGKIISIENSIAEVDIEGNQTRADISTLPGVQPGDYILVHAGFAIEQYDEDEALKTLELLRELAEKMDQP